MRLIDADLLKKNIAKWLQGGDPQETRMVELDDIAVSVIMEIDEQPTAYDVEKVVKQLEALHDLVKINQKLAVSQSIDIVKKGGV
jgi:hypothetical protein